MRSKYFLSLLLTLALAPAAFALDFSGSEVIIPVAGRFPGANSTIWRTDLSVANPDSTAPVYVLMFFETSAELPQRVDISLDPRQTVTYVDVMQSVFHRDNAAGYIRLRTADQTRKVYARARIYNVGSACGEFGQNAPGLPLAQLGPTAFLPELTAVGNRTNVAITNPNSARLDVVMVWFDSLGASRALTHLDVAGHSVYQINDVFDWTGMPRDKPFTVEFRAASSFYAWASIVRNDTGDAVFVPATDASGN